MDELFKVIDDIDREKFEALDKLFHQKLEQAADDKKENSDCNEEEEYPDNGSTENIQTTVKQNVLIPINMNNKK
jgi:hypothetical protein